MKNNKGVVLPVKKIINAINSCQTEEEIENCKYLIHNYVKSAKKNGVINLTDLSERLNDELLQRQEALYLVKIFN
jgi:hypothetical protein